MTTLNDLMEFDHVVFIDEYGHVHDHNTLTPERAGWSYGVTARTRLYSPELIDHLDGDPEPEIASQGLSDPDAGTSEGPYVLGDPRPHSGPLVSNSDQELQRQARSSGWDGLLQGFTGQYGYNGPVMHASEFIGGGIERYILENPGWYCAVVVNAPDDDGTYSSEVAGWSIAYRSLRTDDEGPWVDVVFAGGDDYLECADMGIEEIADYLSQWDMGEETDGAHTTDTYQWGYSDRAYKVGQYVLTTNYPLGYASLNRRPMGTVVTKA